MWERWTNRKLREDFDEVARELKALRADHTELYDRFLRLQGRLAKRGELTVAPAPAESPNVQAGILTGRAAEIQAAILARRGHRVSHSDG